jgi:hypothetical protein
LQFHPQMPQSAWQVEQSSPEPQMPSPHEADVTGRDTRARTAAQRASTLDRRLRHAGLDGPPAVR